MDTGEWLDRWLETKLVAPRTFDKYSTAVTAGGSHDVDGWSYWMLIRDGKPAVTPQELHKDLA